MGNCVTGGASGGRSNFMVGETITMSGYKITGGFVTSPSGRSVSVDSYRELTAAELEQLSRLGNVESPVLVGRMVLPRAVADRAIQQRAQEAAAIQKNVPGLEELRAARAHDSDQRDQFMRSMERGTGILRGDPASHTAAEVEKKYPRAAAYLRAEAWSYASNYMKASFGKTAMNEIASGKSYKKAIDDMRKKWRKYTDNQSRYD